MYFIFHFKRYWDKSICSLYSTANVNIIAFLCILSLINVYACACKDFALGIRTNTDKRGVKKGEDDPKFEILVECPVWMP